MIPSLLFFFFLWNLRELNFKSVGSKEKKRKKRERKRKKKRKGKEKKREREREKEIGDG